MRWKAVLLFLILGASPAWGQVPDPAKCLTVEDVRTVLDKWWAEKLVPPGPNPKPIPAIKPDEAHPVTLPSSITIAVGRQVRIDASILTVSPPTILDVSWLALNEDKVDLGWVGQSAFVTPLQSGRWKLLADVSYKGKVYKAFTTINAGDVPPDPTPPGPVPPIPPAPPGPTPGPAPIPAAGFRVLILYESAELSKIPPDQRQIIFSKDVRDYLNAKCIAGADGKTKEWRMFDKDTDVSSETSIWQAAMQRHPLSLPWMLISTGTSGFEGPLPANPADALTLLKKYGGN